MEHLLVADGEIAFPAAARERDAQDPPGKDGRDMALRGGVQDLQVAGGVSQLPLPSIERHRAQGERSAPGNSGCAGPPEPDFLAVLGPAHPADGPPSSGQHSDSPGAFDDVDVAAIVGELRMMDEGDALAVARHPGVADPSRRPEEDRADRVFELGSIADAPHRRQALPIWSPIRAVDVFEDVTRLASRLRKRGKGTAEA